MNLWNSSKELSKIIKKKAQKCELLSFFNAIYFNNQQFLNFHNILFINTLQNCRLFLLNYLSKKANRYTEYKNWIEKFFIKLIVKNRFGTFHKHFIAASSANDKIQQTWIMRYFLKKST